MPGRMRAREGIAFGVDVGGTSVKAGLVDLSSGAVIGSPRQLATPDPPAIGPVVETIAQIVDDLGRTGATSRLALGVGLSGDVRDGLHTSGVNLHPSWVGAPARPMLEARLRRPLHILNDADAAGLAEMTYGAAMGRGGVVIVLTFGTGIGSALLVDGRLSPNSCLGQLPFHGRDAELTLSARAREFRSIGWQQWAMELNEFLRLVDSLLRPDLIVLGGGASEAAANYWQELDPPCELRPAKLLNRAGIVGAALAAAEAAVPGDGGPAV